jgi:hypothetical protein
MPPSFRQCVGAAVTDDNTLAARREQVAAVAVHPCDIRTAKLTLALELSAGVVNNVGGQTV